MNEHTAIPSKTASRGGYSLLEVLIAGSLIAMGIAAAALVANSAVQQQELNAIASRAINLQEQVSVLYRLGLDYTAITNALPQSFVSGTNEPADVGQYGFTTNSFATTTNGGLVMQSWSNGIVYVSGFVSTNVVRRTNSVILLRESIR